jgi:gluconolactonase
MEPIAPIDLGFTEGPVVVPDGVAVCSITTGSVFVLGNDASVQRVPTGGGPNGMTSDSEGTFYVAQNGGMWGGLDGEAGVQRISNGEVDYIVTGLDAPNDICFGPDGRLYITDPGRGGHPRDISACAPGKLWSCNPDGSDLAIVHEGLRFINGLAFDRDGEALYLVETATKLLHRCSWRHGDIDEPVPIAEFETPPDGMAIDAAGNLYVATTSGDSVEVLSAEGTWLSRHILPEGSFATNCCFGGEALDVLYVTAGKRGCVMRTPVTVKGLPLRRGALDTPRALS